MLQAEHAGDRCLPSMAAAVEARRHFEVVPCLADGAPPTRGAVPVGERLGIGTGPMVFCEGAWRHGRRGRRRRGLVLLFEEAQLLSAPLPGRGPRQTREAVARRLILMQADLHRWC